MHHIHISAPFAFVVLLFIFGIVALIVWSRRPAPKERVEVREVPVYRDRPVSPVGDPGHTHGVYATVAPVYVQAPPPPVAPYYGIPTVIRLRTC